MDQKTFTQEIDGITGDFTRTAHGVFVVEYNGLRWPYSQGAQPAYESPEEAVSALLRHFEEE